MTNTVDIQNEQLKKGSHSTYKELFTRWYEPLCNYAFSIVRDMDEAEDIVQKMFCKLWDNRENINIRTSVKSYLYRAVHTDCISRVQRVKTRAEQNQHYSNVMPQVVNNTSERVKHKELESSISNAIGQLPPQCKKVFEMSRMQHLSYSEIAQELGISNNTVENHISKALKLLRANLKDFLMALLLLNILLN